MTILMTSGTARYDRSGVRYSYQNMLCLLRGVPAHTAKIFPEVKMKPISKLFTLFSLVILTTFVFVPSALAFDGRGGEKIVIPKDEVINEDLYLGATEIIVEGTINGDLMAGGNTVIINGKVTGDLFAAAGAITLGPSAKIGDDVFSAGASVETRTGSQVGGDLIVGAGQILAEGGLTGDMLAGANRLRLEGTVGGDVTVDLGSVQGGFSPSIFYSPTSLPMPSVPAGLTFGPEAKVNGSLEYTSQDVVYISSTVAAKVTHKLPPMDQELSREIAQRTGPTSYVFNQVRRLVALLFVGLLLAWLAPRWITRAAEMVQSRPLPSLGIGFVGVVAAPIVFMTALGVVIVLAVIFGTLSLVNLTGLALLTGFPLLGLAFAAFLIVVSYLCQSALAYLAGRWILNKVRPEWNSKIYLPLLLGLVILGLLFAIPFAGGFLQFFVVLAGLGAIISLMLQRPSAPVIAESL